MPCSAASLRSGRKTNTFTIGLKAATTGGRYETPLNLEASGRQGRAMYDYSRAFSEQLPAYFRADVKLGYKINRARLTHEIAVDLQNVSGAENIFQRSYNPRTNKIGHGLPARVSAGAVLSADLLAVLGRRHPPPRDYGALIINHCTMLTRLICRLLVELIRLPGPTGGAGKSFCTLTLARRWPVAGPRAGRRSPTWPRHRRQAAHRPVGCNFGFIGTRSHPAGCRLIVSLLS